MMTNQSYRVQETSSTTNFSNQSGYPGQAGYPGQPGPATYQPAPGPPGSGQPFAYTPEPPMSTSPDPISSSSYSKYSSVKQTSTTTNNRSQLNGNVSPPPVVVFPQQPPANRSATPQNPPKRIDDLMSEFQEYDSGAKSGSPTPAMFFKPQNPSVVVTELPDQPPAVGVSEHNPVIREPSPPPGSMSQEPIVSVKGPGVYYPPGAEFKRAEPAEPRPVADGGSMSLVDGGKGKAKGRREKYDRGEDESNRQGAAVIPICFPLCCAAPCVIM